MRVTKHYNYDPSAPVNYTWPEQVSYHNPVGAVKWQGGYGYGYVYWFKLQSGDKTDNGEADNGFQDLDWSKITSLVIRYYPNNSCVAGFEFYNSEN